MFTSVTRSKTHHEILQEKREQAPGTAVALPGAVATHQNRDDATDRLVTAIDWRRDLPVLRSADVTLRGLHTDDAPHMLRHLTNGPVVRYIAHPPTSVEGF